MSNTHCFTASFPEIAHALITNLVSFCFAIIDFTRFSKWLPCNSRKNHNWLRSNHTLCIRHLHHLHLLIGPNCIRYHLHGWILIHKLLLLLHLSTSICHCIRLLVSLGLQLDLSDHIRLHLNVLIGLHLNHFHWLLLPNNILLHLHLVRV